METAASWRSLFENWPEVIPRSGTVVTNYSESVPFTNFMISGQLLLIDRNGPDTSGNRKVILGYDAIAAVKLSTAGELSKFQSMGFQAPM